MFREWNYNDDEDNSLRDNTNAVKSNLLALLPHENHSTLKYVYIIMITIYKFI